MRDEDRRQLDGVTGLLDHVLGDELVGAYLFGSAVLGGLQPESDLDVLAVSERRTSLDEKRRLADALLRSSGHPRRLELTVVVHADVRPWRYPPSLDFQYGDWLRAEFERGEPTPWPGTASLDLATLLTMVLLADAPLAGPPPAAVLDPVPRADLVRAMLDGIDPLLADLEHDTANVLLTLARSWCTVATGEIRSKDTAAEWALTRLPEEHRAVLAGARAVYLGADPDRRHDVGAQACADRLAAAVTAAASGP
jgi:predicted nucleotidyltransferase